MIEYDKLSIIFENHCHHCPSTTILKYVKLNSNQLFSFKIIFRHFTALLCYHVNAVLSYHHHHHHNHNDIIKLTLERHASASSSSSSSSSQYHHQ